MLLSLSSAAAPDAALADLLAACARRGLAGLELVEGHAHDVGAGVGATRVEAVCAAARDAGIEICAIYRERLLPADLESSARFAARLGAPLVVPAAGVDREILSAASVAFRKAGTELLVAHGSDSAADALLQPSTATGPELESIGVVWEVRPHRDDPALVQRVLADAGGRLRYVRLHGGGPEAAEQTGMGVGALVGRLALARYGGPLVLTPSTSRYHYVWRAWLGRAGGWGCGSKASDPSLVTFQH